MEKKNKSRKRTATKANIPADDMDDSEYFEELCSSSLEGADEVKKMTPTQKKKMEADRKNKDKALKEKYSTVNSVNKLLLNRHNNKKMNRVILWLRNDLRMHDNYVFNWAMQTQLKSGQAKEIIPVFCFDPRIYNKDHS